jgi:3,4-dihydroxy 2-butanone 4-phosphate synthase/GTP cyclohydrolase II
MTNNPDKTSSLESYGIPVAERVALTPRPNDHNLTYLLTKRDRMGHQLDGLSGLETVAAQPPQEPEANRVPEEGRQGPSRRVRPDEGEQR